MFFALFAFLGTYSGTILHRKAKKLRKGTDGNYSTDHEWRNPSASCALSVQFSRVAYHMDYISKHVVTLAKVAAQSRYNTPLVITGTMFITVEPFQCSRITQARTF